MPKPVPALTLAVAAALTLAGCSTDSGGEATAAAPTASVTESAASPTPTQEGSTASTWTAEASSGAKVTLEIDAELPADLEEYFKAAESRENYTFVMITSSTGGELRDGNSTPKLTDPQNSQPNLSQIAALGSGVINSAGPNSHATSGGGYTLDSGRKIGQEEYNKLDEMGLELSRKYKADGQEQLIYATTDDIPVQLESVAATVNEEYLEFTPDEGSDQRTAEPTASAAPSDIPVQPDPTAPASTATPQMWEGGSPSGAVVTAEIDAHAPEDLAEYFAAMGVDDVSLVVVNVEPEGGENSAGTPRIVGPDGAVSLELVVGEDQVGGLLEEVAPKPLENGDGYEIPQTGQLLNSDQGYRYVEMADELVDKYESAETAKMLVFVTRDQLPETPTSVEVDYGSDTVALQQAV